VIRDVVLEVVVVAKDVEVADGDEPHTTSRGMGRCHEAYRIGGVIDEDDNASRMMLRMTVETPRPRRMYWIC
jgi:hypothetical protein